MSDSLFVFDAVNHGRRFGIVVGVRRHYFIAVQRKKIAGLYFRGGKARGIGAQAFVVNDFFDFIVHGFSAVKIDMRYVVCIVSAHEHGKIARVEVIGMAVRNQAVFNLRPVEFIFLIMRHGIGVEIDEDFVVYKRLRAGTKIFSAERERAPARFALTEQSGNALIGSRAEILDFHEIFLLGKIVCPPGSFFADDRLLL